VRRDERDGREGRTRWGSAGEGALILLPLGTAAPGRAESEIRYEDMRSMSWLRTRDWLSPYHSA